MQFSCHSLLQKCIRASLHFLRQKKKQICFCFKKCLCFVFELLFSTLSDFKTPKTFILKPHEILVKWSNGGVIEPGAKRYGFESQRFPIDYFFSFHVVKKRKYLGVMKDFILSKNFLFEN